MAATTKCPCCLSSSFKSTVEIPGILHPYVECVRCGTWVNPAFVWGKFEADVDVDQGKAQILAFKGAYDELARRLLVKLHPDSVLDVGSRYPLLLACMREANPDLRVLGIDGCNSAAAYGAELEVPVAVGDFMAHDFHEETFDLVTMVHVLEHFLDPAETLARVHNLLGPDKYVFLRTPRADCAGISEHLTPKHYEVHPYIFSAGGLTHAINSLVDESGKKAYAIADFWSHGGSMDFILIKSC